MYKNALILGAARSGKTTLARLLNRGYGYSVASVDDLVCAFEEAFPSLEIVHDGGDEQTAARLAPFLNRWLRELSEGPAFYGGCKYAVEGTHIDIGAVMAHLDRSKYAVVGLTYNSVTPQALFEAIRAHDTEDDWTKWIDDGELRGDARYFVGRNAYFSAEFRKYGIKTFDTSLDRVSALSAAAEYLRSDGV